MLGNNEETDTEAWQREIKTPSPSLKCSQSLAWLRYVAWRPCERCTPERGAHSHLPLTTRVRVLVSKGLQRSQQLWLLRSAGPQLWRISLFSNTIMRQLTLLKDTVSQVGEEKPTVTKSTYCKHRAKGSQGKLLGPAPRQLHSACSDWFRCQLCFPQATGKLDHKETPKSCLSTDHRLISSL